jgi:hypothetical protein
MCHLTKLGYHVDRRFCGSSIGYTGTEPEIYLSEGAKAAGDGAMFQQIHWATRSPPIILEVFTLE